MSEIKIATMTFDDGSYTIDILFSDGMIVLKRSDMIEAVHDGTFETIDEAKELVKLYYENQPGWTINYQ